MLKIQDGCIYSAHIVALQTGRATILLNKTKIVGSESHDVFSFGSIFKTHESL